MPLDPIQRRPISDPLRAEFQERVARAVETDPEPFLASYQAHPDTHGGRYVAADMMKEVFPEFSASREGRTAYNIPLHNSAAVLASEQFRRAVADTSHPERDTAIFLTGVPGAGKTSAILDNNQLQRNVRVVYEGQLATPGPAIAKIQAALDAGLKVRIVAIHLQPEVALENTFGRFEREGTRCWSRRHGERARQPPYRFNRDPRALWRESQSFHLRPPRRHERHETTGRLGQFSRTWKRRRL